MSNHRNPPSRRDFLSAAGAAVMVSAARASAHPSERASEMQPSQVLITGNGEWTYEVISGWGALPPGTSFGGTHGAIAQDKSGNIYVSTQSTTGILIYSSEGRLLKKIAAAFPEVHSMVYAEEGGAEYFYTTVQKGTPEENWLFVKMKTDGTPVLKITAPPEAGFKLPNEWRITALFLRPTVPFSLPMDTAIHGSFTSMVKGTFSGVTPARDRSPACSIAVTDLHSTRATISRCCLCAIAKTAGCANLIWMADT